MSRAGSVFAGLLMVSSLSGCCLLGHGCGGGYAPYGGGGYYGGGGCAPCQSGACGAVAPGYPSAGLYNPAVPQAALLPAQISAANMQPPGYPQQMVMTDTLSTY
jgi:hypothetical protein